jgi:trehalose-6-phosphatase
LITRLEDLLKRRPYKVLRGNRVIEVRHEHVTKGSAVGHLLERHPRADFVFCAGDDSTDEDMMRAIPDRLLKKAVRCWVGAPNTNAEYWRESNAGLLGELEVMAGIWERGSAARNSSGASSRSSSKTSSKKVPAKKTSIRKPSSKKAPSKKASTRATAVRGAATRKKNVKKVAAAKPATKTTTKKKSPRTKGKKKVTRSKS